MTFDLGEAVKVLAATPATLRQLLTSLPENWLRINEGPQTWSAYDIVGHLIHGEKTDWIPRARIILQHGTDRPFPPFDRFAQLDGDQTVEITSLLEEFARLRSDNLETLGEMNLTEADFDKTGLHPEFGEVTLKQLLATWVVHDLGHIRQIARVLAKYYRDDIGPWRAYLPVVNE